MRPVPYLRHRNTFRPLLTLYLGFRLSTVKRPVLDWCITHGAWEYNTFCDGPMGYCTAVETLNETPTCVMVDSNQPTLPFFDSVAVLDEIAQGSS